MRYFRIDVENNYFTDSVYQAIANDCTDRDIEEIAAEIAEAISYSYDDIIKNEFRSQKADYNGDLEDLLTEIENSYYDSITYKWEEISVEDFRMNAEDWIYGA